MSNGHLTFDTCIDGKRETIASDAPITQAVNFEANWSSKGTMLLKIDKKLVGKPQQVGVLTVEPTGTIQIGGDTGIPVGPYKSPNGFLGTIENLTTKHPIGS